MMYNTIQENKEIIKKSTSALCRHFGFEEDVFYNNKRGKEISMVRKILFYILHREMKMSSYFLSREFNITRRAFLRDCSSIGSHIKIYDDCIKKYNEIRELINKFVDL